MSRFRRKLLAAWVIVLVCAAGGNRGWAAQVLMKDGRILQGKLAPTSGLAEAPKPPNPDGSRPPQLILAVDDGLRRTFVPKSARQILEVRQDDPAQVQEKFRLRQQTRQSGYEVASVGLIVRTKPFDEYGRRILTMNAVDGPVNVIQAITEITPLWTKVEGVTHVWDMRLATSSIPRETLGKILRKQLDPNNAENRIRIANFFVQSERYEDATAELKSILTDFPNLADIKERVEPSIRRLKQLGAKRLLDELERRRNAGQHALVLGKLKTFPADSVAGEILQAVREMIQEYETALAQREETLQQFDALLEKVEDQGLKKQIAPVREEIFAELNLNTLGRMAAFLEMAGDEDLRAEERLALATSGWLLGSDSATRNLAVAISLFEVRNLVRQYLNTPDKLGRARILEQFYPQEGATPQYVAKLLALMTPPLEVPPEVKGKPGHYELEIPGPDAELPIPYLVQLPPEYDPHRRYPAIVTLHGASGSPELQIDWWAGMQTEAGWRAGQATRHGYIVIAPNWALEHQKQYQYSALEHAAVLFCLRDACRRFSIDTDRVFLTGHSMGGDAAWDIGLAHPDLWAGVIPVSARADRYCAHYWENAARVPFYVVGGEKDGRWIVDNARDLDRYLEHGYNTTVVEYLGRGHEHFSDEILRLFDWMGRFERDFFPRQFLTKSMRPWDNFFWWVELRQLPPGTQVDPVDWPPARGTRPAPTEAKLTATNGIWIKTGAGKVTVWLSPDMLDFDQRISISVNGRGAGPRAAFLEPDLETLLEDARTRGDRQHPFWLKVEN